LIALIGWVAETQIGATIFIYLFTPLAVWLSAFSVSEDLRVRIVPNTYDKAGLYAKSYLTNEERSKLVIVGTVNYDPELFESMFWVDNASASFDTLPEGAPYDLSTLTPGKELALVIGNHPVLNSDTYQLSLLEGFTLARSRHRP
jgi:phosphoglycerol transferase